MVMVGNGRNQYTYTDHLGSVTALTKKVGTTFSIVAKRSFDPWGRERNATTWNGAPGSTPAWLYRGFTGHEHVQPFGLISPALGAVAVTRVESAKPPRLSLRRDSRRYRDERKASTALGGTAISGRSRPTAPWSGLHMNARMYDPLNGRMLSPDNYVNGAFASQAFNRYSYACNNPLKFIDPDGNSPFWIADAAFIVGSVLNEVLNGLVNGDITDWNSLGNSISEGWNAYQRASAGLASVTSIDLAHIDLGDFDMNLRLGLNWGTSTGVGLMGNITYSSGNFNASVGGSIYGFAGTYGPSGMQLQGTYGGGIGWDDGTNGAGLYTSHFSSGSTSQSVGGIRVRHGDWGFATESDFLPGGDGGDRYRTAAANLSYKDHSLILRIFTGNPGSSVPTQGGGKAGTYPGPEADAYRWGSLSYGQGNREFGISSEGIRHFFQNRLIHDGFLDLLGEPSPWFRRMPQLFPWSIHSQYGPSRPFTMW